MPAPDDLRGVRGAARALIADADRWCTCAYAVDATGTRVDPDDERAVRWDIYGAVYRVAGMTGWVWPPGTLDLLAQTAYRLHGTSVAAVNDRLGHGAVLRLLDAARAASPHPPSDANTRDLRAGDGTTARRRRARR